MQMPTHDHFCSLGHMRTSRSFARTIAFPAPNLCSKRALLLGWLNSFFNNARGKEWVTELFLQHMMEIEWATAVLGSSARSIMCYSTSLCATVPADKYLSRCLVRLAIDFVFWDSERCAVMPPFCQLRCSRKTATFSWHWRPTTVGVSLLGCQRLFMRQVLILRTLLLMRDLISLLRLWFMAGSAGWFVFQKPLKQIDLKGNLCLSFISGIGHIRYIVWGQCPLWMNQSQPSHGFFLSKSVCGSVFHEPFPMVHQFPSLICASEILH